MDSKNQLLNLPVGRFLEVLEDEFIKKSITIKEYNEIRENYFKLNKKEDKFIDFKPIDQKFYTNKFIKLEDYSNFQSIKENFQALRNVNKDFNFYGDEEEDEKIMVIICRSKNYDDLQKAVKYGVWTSGFKTNTKILKNFEKMPIFIVFTVLNSENFFGVARVIEKPIINVFYNYWSEPAKWKGLIKLEWVLLSIVAFNCINIKKENKLITELVDGNELEREQYLELFKIFIYNIETDNEDLKNTLVYKKLLTKFNNLDNKEILLRENRDLMVKAGTFDLIFEDQSDYNNQKKHNYDNKNDNSNNIIMITKKKPKKKKKK